VDQFFAKLQEILVLVTQIADAVWPFAHPKQVLASLLTDSVGLVSHIWFHFILSTTNIEISGGRFIDSGTIQRFEPKVQLLANAALALIAVWASYRIMWGHGLHSQYTARILLPRLFMGVVLVNFALPLFQVVVEANNTVCSAIQSFGTLSDPSTWWSTLLKDPKQGAWEIVTTAVLVVGYDVLAIAYLVRYAVLMVLAITAPIAGLLFTLPETHHVWKLWFSHFVTNLLMQPAQLFVLSIGFALENNGLSPIRHLFALASLLIVFKVPGAMGGSEKAAHKLESTVSTAFRHMAHALVKA
jgi:hypothetical protein